RAQAGQQHVRSLELAQSSGRLKLSGNRGFGGTAETRSCDIHSPTHQCAHMHVQRDSEPLLNKRIASEGRPSTTRPWQHTPRSFVTGPNICEEFEFPSWIDELRQDDKPE
ncbi:hypothetical protein JG688_00011447, partial [Phytophthora aleatoria]